MKSISTFSRFRIAAFGFLFASILSLAPSAWAKVMQAYVAFTPTAVENTTFVFSYPDDITVEKVGSSYLIPTNYTATVVYTVADDYVFPDGSTVKTNTVDAATDPATETIPAAPVRIHRHDGVPFGRPIADYAALTELFATGGNGYLVADIVVPTCKITTTVSLCLNGFRLTPPGFPSGGNFILLGDSTLGGNLSLCDCNTTTKHYWKGYPYAQYENAFTIWSNVVSAAEADYVTTGGVCSLGICVNEGNVESVQSSFTARNIAFVGAYEVKMLEGGSMSLSNCVIACSSGWAIDGIGGTFKLEDCLIEKTGQGGIRSDGCKNSTVMRTKIRNSLGSGVFTSEPMTFVDCEITGNGGGLACGLEEGSVTVGGCMIVTNNVFDAETAEEIGFYGQADVVLYPGVTLNLSEESPLTMDSCIGVLPLSGEYAPTTGVVTSASETDYSDCFFADDSQYYIFYNADKRLELGVKTPKVTFDPPPVPHATLVVLIDGAEVEKTGGVWLVPSNATAQVVCTANEGFFFADGSSVKTNAVDAAVDPAMADAFDAPFEPVASVTIDDVTTSYATLMDAWAFATNNQDLVDVSVKLLKDAAVSTGLTRTVSGMNGRTLTIDLNDCVLSYAGEDDTCFIRQTGGDALHIVDTATTRTPRYFTCDQETGLWSLTNEVTERVVSGGLITGAREGAVRFTYGSGMVSNVNFVGNRSVSNGGAVSVMTGTTKIFNSTFLGNTASGNGGAIYAITPYEMTDCRVESNVADLQGGGIYSKHHGTFERTRVVGNRAGMEGGGVYLTKATGCFAAGTKILMADGHERNIEDIVTGDVIATFDHEGGTNSSAAVCLAYSGEGSFPAVTLTFASGATLTIVDRHDLLVETTRKYVTLTTENAGDFIGARFYNFRTSSWDELRAVAAEGDQAAFYSLYTAHHLNCVANGFLTVADDVDWYLNIYELGESLQADAERLAADIRRFGLVSIDEYPVLAEDPQAFEDFNTRYAHIAVGKGLVSYDDLWSVFRNSDFAVAAKPASVSMAKRVMSAPMMTLSVSEPVTATTFPYLQFGSDVIVTGNVSAADAASNVYLDRSFNAVVDILDGATGVDVGVMLSSGAGIFGWTNTVNYAASFFADNPIYAVSYTADGELALRAGIQVGDDAWATIEEDGVCTIAGTGAMWNANEWTAGNPLAAYRTMMTMVGVKDGITTVGSQLFHKFYALTNVTCAASVTTVGDHAFYRCHSLTGMNFAALPTFAEQAYSLQAAIYMKDGMPQVYAIPEITISGYKQVLLGKDKLTDATWTPITSEAEKANYHFFKIELQAE